MPKDLRVKSRKIVYQKGPICVVDALLRLPNGRKVSRQILAHPGAVVIIPELKTNQYILVKQFRYAANQSLWEWPAGGIEKDEPLMACARRELMEEAGYYPAKLKKICSFYPTPGVSEEMMHIFHGSELRPAKAVQDEDEDIKTGVFTLEEISALVKKNQIIDAKTLIGFYYLRESAK
jgi:ADP-ribose pyrophosphatase